MRVYYQGEQWDISFTLRDHLLSVLRESRPDKVVKITKGTREKNVKLKDLKNEAEFRNQ